MSRIIAWLNNKLLREDISELSHKPIVREFVEPESVPLDEYTIETSFDPAVPGRISSETSEKNVLVPDNLAESHEPTEPLLNILDQSSSDVDVSAGFNPYDTVVLHEKPGSKKR